MDTAKVDVARERLDWTAERSETLLLRMLGKFRLQAGSREVTLSPRGQQLLALLALRPHLDRSQVAGTLWDASSEEHALGSLRTELWRLNQQVPGCVLGDGRRLRLNPTTWVDVDDFVRRGRRLLDPRAELHFEDVPDPWQSGDLLAGWGHAWLALDRERLRQMWLHVCETAALRLSALGHHSLALDCALGALHMEPTRESAYRTLITVHWREGNLIEARRVFTMCVDMLEHELGAAPTFTLDLSGAPPRPAGPGPGMPHWVPPPVPAARGRGSS